MRAQLRLITRLAWRNLTARPTHAVLLLTAICLATTTLSMALAVNETGDHAWDRTWRAGKGADVTIVAGYDATQLPATPDLTWATTQLRGIAAAPGVDAATGPWPQLSTSGTIGGAALNLVAMVREPAPAAVDQPIISTGHWLDAHNGVVLEEGLAAALHIHPGDTITVAGQPVTVAGTALAVSAPRYRPTHLGYLWITPATADVLRAGGAKDQAEILNVRLTHPADAARFAATHAGTPADPRPAAFIEGDTMAFLRSHNNDDLATLSTALMIIAVMLAGLMIAITAVIVAARMTTQTRQIGTLKAIGVTPWQVTAILLTEYLAIAAAATAIGVFCGTRLSPLLARSEAVLYGAPQAPAITAGRVLTVAGVAAAMVALATIRPALRGTRHSTLRSLTATVRPPRPPRRAGWTPLPLPLPVRLGIRTALRRPGRFAANVTGLALAVAIAVIGIALRNSQPHQLTDAAKTAANTALLNEVRTILYAAAITLAALALINSIVIAALAARDSAHNAAITRTLGATPTQTVTAFLTSQLGACLTACLLGIPLGTLLFDTFAHGLEPAHLPTTTYLTITGTALLLYSAAVAAPARLLSTQSPAHQLTHE